MVYDPTKPARVLTRAEMCNRLRDRHSLTVRVVETMTPMTDAECNDLMREAAKQFSGKVR